MSGFVGARIITPPHILPKALTQWLLIAPPLGAEA
jgi:hypothetical protein